MDKVTIICLIAIAMATVGMVAGIFYDQRGFSLGMMIAALVMAAVGGVFDRRPRQR